MGTRYFHSKEVSKLVYPRMVRLLVVLLVVLVAVALVTAQQPEVKGAAHEKKRCSGSKPSGKNCRNPPRLYHFNGNKCKELPGKCYNVQKYSNAFYSMRDCTKACY